MSFVFFVYLIISNVALSRWLKTVHVGGTMHRPGFVSVWPCNLV